MLVCSEVELLLLCFLGVLRVVVDVEKKLYHRQKTLIYFSRGESGGIEGVNSEKGQPRPMMSF